MFDEAFKKLQVKLVHISLAPLVGDLPPGRGLGDPVLVVELRQREAGEANTELGEDGVAPLLD